MKRAFLLLIFAAAAFAQRQMSIAQLTGFIKSSVEQKLADKEIAEVLKKTTLTEKLDPSTVGQLMSLGAGPRTSAALRELSDTSQSLPAAPKTGLVVAAPKPAAVTYATPSPEEQKAILEQIRDYANNYTQNLPNFICTQVTRRQMDPSGTGDQYRQMDKLQEQLTYFDCC